MDPVRPQATANSFSQSIQSIGAEARSPMDAVSRPAQRAAWPGAGSVELDQPDVPVADGSAVVRATAAVEAARHGMPPTRAELIDGADAASAAYDGAAPPGMRRHAPGSLGVSEEAAWSGFQSAVFERTSDGTVFVSLTGTQDAVDWINNGLQGAGAIPPQYLQAAELVAAARERYGDRVVVVGHSLGGGLASFAGLLNGVRTMTFNAAGLGLGARTWAWAGGQLDANRALITNLNLKGEFLTSEPLLKPNVLTQEQIGRVIEIDPPDPTPSALRDPLNRLEKRALHDHKMEQVLRALRGPADLVETRRADASPEAGWVERLGDSVFGAITNEVAEAARDAVKSGAGLGKKAVAVAAGALGLLQDLSAVNELTNGDRTVKELGAQGRRRDAVAATFATVGAFSGSVADAASSAGRRLPLLGRILSDIGLKEGGRALGRELGEGVNNLLDIQDVSPGGRQQMAVAADK